MRFQSYIGTMWKYRREPSRIMTILDVSDEGCFTVHWSSTSTFNVTEPFRPAQFCEWIKNFEKIDL